ncbi:GDP-mannose-dependent alpha-(1-6)-phosphatidylinositol monomannoside mannosyltransferase [Zhongshania aliphaticivorans]|uniref:GDP-mannose-dependent alpha-(1-6)-phosphatidylinositol monomannoside mannosyltransferase n=1 Tax=Zhongshania aliphaticivorans TaxID=1470434 RepID=A0A5S9Q3D8_9GAMM|nr:glycosyltransferase family 4 protein [Zhongshania aliphaticivorans]CAA0111647.1 GDP-mannose-dependent alpha-(1-6)-phosphatidylinositol monomannoside mannosyltransferase [Zhongshania aliphaticivorans]CAA0118738.1 GDP-mannose-dependent alpha-(1-6)-phosphatidylinositol monomannoside mannosyltransferase [Zhongshania aliphaticivorans]
MQAVNILINTQNFPPEAGGIQNYMYELANALHHLGHNVRVICDTHATAGQQEFDASQPFSIERINGPKLIRRFRKAQRITRYLRGTNPTLLICDSWKSLELLQLEKRHLLACVCIAHGMEFPKQTTAKKQKRISNTLLTATHILANSKFTASRIHPYVENTSNIQILHPGVGQAHPPSEDDVTKITQLIANRSPVLLTVGRLEERKGQDKIIEILPKLLQDHPQLLYVIAGNGPLQGTLINRTEELGIVDHVIFCGRVSDGQRTALLQKADLFAMPCRAVGDSVEGFGIVYIEAAMLALPSLAGRIGGAGDAVIDGHTGLLCDGDNENDIYQSITKMLNDKQALKVMGQNAQHRAQTELQWEQIANRLLALSTNS